MFRIIFMQLMVLCLSASCTAQASAPSDFLEGKTFAIDNYINGQLDNSEDVIFIDGKMEGTVCTEYGFQGADYQIVKEGKTSVEFECTMHSVVEGKMVWKATASKNKIKGTCLWTKAGQEPILLTFDGKLKS